MKKWLKIMLLIGFLGLPLTIGRSTIDRALQRAKIDHLQAVQARTIIIMANNLGLTTSELKKRGLIK